MANKKKTEITIHSSAAEYLTFVAATGDSENSYEMRYEDENIWLTQKMMAALYDVSVAAISQHIKRIYEDGELMPEATIKKYLTVQSEGRRQVLRNLDHYNLRMIIAVGFKVNNQRAVQFRKWAGQIVKDYTIQGWMMDKERLKNGHMFTQERIVTLYLNYAKLQAERHIPMSMEDWAKRLDGFLEFNGNELLTGAGKVSAEQAKLHAETEFEKYRIIQDKLFMSDFDRYMLELSEAASDTDSTPE